MHMFTTYTRVAGPWPAMRSATLESQDGTACRQIMPVEVFFVHDTRLSREAVGEVVWGVGGYNGTTWEVVEEVRTAWRAARLRGGWRL